VAIELASLLDSLGQGGAFLDYEANRARTSHANRLRDIAAMGLKRRGSLADSLASSGMIHSGVNLTQQTELGSMLDDQRAAAGQDLNDRLMNIARQKISDEMGFKVNSLLPR
jgi:fructose-1,6-bisphosphatase